MDKKPDILLSKLDEVAGGLYLVFDPEEYVPYNIKAIQELSKKYGIPKNVEFVEAIKHVGATEEELASIYLHPKQ